MAVNHMKSKWKLLSIIISGYIFKQLLFGTPPTPDPSYQYIVSGQLQRINNNARDKFQIVLVGKSLRNYPDSLIELIKTNINYPSNCSISITDTSGNYYLDLNTKRYDSLGLRVFAVDKPTYTTELFAIPNNNIVSIYSEITKESSGCNGCVNEPTTNKYISGYQIQMFGKSINLPY
jgi:hypothetical protein